MHLVTRWMSGSGAHVRGASHDDDRGNVDKCVDIIDACGLVEQAGFGRVRRLVARLAAITFDGVEQRGLLSANVSARAAPQLDVEAESATENMVSQQAACAARRNGVSDAPCRERVFA